MGLGFAPVPAAPAYRLRNARAPLALLRAGGLAGDAEGLTRIDMTVEDGIVASIVPAGTYTLDADLPAVDLDGGLLFPRFVDIHTHLDKGQIWPRRPNPDGTFTGALEATAADREANWSAEDVRARMEFSLRCAYGHGTGAMRTHLDSIGKQAAISWPVFAEMRERWRGRIALQAVSLFPIDLALDDEAAFDEIVRLTAEHGGILGGVTFTGEAPGERTAEALDCVVRAARDRGLDLDFHVDESGAPEARTLERVIDAVLFNDFAGKILCGHCCALSRMEDCELAPLIARVADARIAIVGLPMCNLYLQDREAGRTPRWRGVAPLHELRAAGVPVTIASDNARDPFYAYGDLDMLEVFREATRILHLDHAGPDWIRAVTVTPADLMGLDRHGRLEAGDAADLVLTRARSWTELMARPQSDRTVLVGGRPIDTTPPDYRELDEVLKIEASFRGSRSENPEPMTG
jgi:cytosine/creatinine deaminase